MDRNLIIILTAVMFTIALRILPFYIKRDRPYPQLVDDFLSFVPYTAIGALIFPGIINVTRDIRISLVSFLAVLIISYKRGGMIMPIVSGIFVSISLLYLTNI